MKCFSRSTLGVVISILNILFYIGVCIFSTGALIKLSSASDELHEPIEFKYQGYTYDEATLTPMFSVALVVSLIMIIISGLLIMGIVKKRHNLILPWLIISFVGYAGNAIKFLVDLVVGITNGTRFSSVIAMFFIGILVIGIQTLILWKIFTLYRDIRDNKADNTKGRINSAPEVGYAADRMTSYEPQTNYYSTLQLKNAN